MAKWAFLSLLVMALTKLGDFPRWLAFSFSSKVLSVALGNKDSSSRIAKMPKMIEDVTQLCRLYLLIDT